MSQIAILGASGQLGSHLLTEALDAGWLVHALSRDPSRIRKANERLTLFRGDAEKGEGLEPLVTGCRYIIYAVDSRRPAECVAHLVRAVGWKVIERVVLVSRATTRLGAVPSLLATLFPPLRRVLPGDVERAEELLRLSGLPYCIFRAAELTQGPPGQPLMTTQRGEALPGPISRADFARFIIGSLSDRSWNLKEVTVGTRSPSTTATPGA